MKKPRIKHLSVLHGIAESITYTYRPEEDLKNEITMTVS